MAAATVAARAGAAADSARVAVTGSVAGAEAVGWAAVGWAADSAAELVAAVAVGELAVAGVSEEGLAARDQGRHPRPRRRGQVTGRRCLLRRLPPRPRPRHLAHLPLAAAVGKARAPSASAGAATSAGAEPLDHRFRHQSPSEAGPHR